MLRKSRSAGIPSFFWVLQALILAWVSAESRACSALVEGREQAPLTHQSRQATDTNPEQICPGWAHNSRNKQWAPVRQEQGMGSLCFSPNVSFTCGQGSRVKGTNSASRMVPAAKQDHLRRRSHRALGRQSHRASATSGEAGVVVVPFPRQTAGLQQMRHQATLPSPSQSVSIVKGMESHCSD